MIYFLFFYKGNDFRNEIKDQYQEKNVEVMKKKTGGSAEEMSVEQVEKAFTLASVEDLQKVVWQTTKPHRDDPLKYLNEPLAAPVFGTLLERYDPERKLIFFKPNRYQTISNALLNIIVLGQSGSGKSFTISRNMHFQAAMRGESVFINDPSGELYADGAVLGRNRGASVKLLNLIDFSRSDSWNCIQECINETTGRVSSKQVGMFATVFVMNAEGDDEEEDFWKKQSIGYMKAAIAYVAYLHEDAIMSSYKKIFDHITCDIPESEKISKSFRDLTPLTWCEKMILKSAVSSGYDVSQVYQLMEKARKTAPKFTLARVVEVLADDTKMQAMDTFYTTGNCPKKYFGKRAYTSVKRQDTPTSIVESAMTTLRGKLSLFDDEMLLYNLSHDGISTTDFNKKQCLYYLSMDTQETTIKPIASLFVTFLLRNAQLTYNAAQRIAEESGAENPRLPITCILDETPSLGLIGGTQEWFPLFLSNSRKAGCKTVIMSQTVGMLKAIYGEYQWQTIQSNCEINMILGVNDEGTSDYVTNFLGGDATFLTESHKMNIGITNRVSNDEVTISAGTGKLLDTSTNRRLKDEILLVKHGEHPIEIEPLPYTRHPMAKEIIKKSVQSSITSYYYKIHAEAVEQSHHSTMNFEDELNCLTVSYVSEEERYRLGQFFLTIQYVDPEQEYIQYNSKTGEVIISEEIQHEEYCQDTMEDDIDADVIAEQKLKEFMGNEEMPIQQSNDYIELNVISSLNATETSDSSVSERDQSVPDKPKKRKKTRKKPPVVQQPVTKKENQSPLNN